MPVHDCVDVFNNTVVAQVVPICRPQASSCGAAHFRQPFQIDGVHVLPVVKRAVSMDQAHWAVRGLNFEREGQGGEALANASECVAVEIVEPFATMNEVVNFCEWQALGAAPGQKVMIAADGVKPPLVQPGEHLVRFRAPVYQVAN